MDKLDDEYPSDEPWEQQDDPDDECDYYIGECHMTSDGYCGLAGSEWCEFECPFRR